MLVDIENIESLRYFLTNKGHLDPNENIEFRILNGGVSNKTVWIRKANGTEWVLKQALEKLRVKSDWYSKPIRSKQEALGLKWFRSFSVNGSVPELIFVDDDQHILAMEAIPEPHENFKALLLHSTVQKDYFVQLGELLADVHLKGIKNQSQISKIFSEYSFFKDLRLEPYYEYTALQFPEFREFLNNLCEDCRSNRYTLVHGDFSPKNILIRNKKIVLLDYEVVHFGDGTFDIGFFLTHILSKANHLPLCRPSLFQGALTFVDTYIKKTKDHWTEIEEERAISHCLACLLARIYGKSPLEYLNKDEQRTQAAIVESMIIDKPISLVHLIQHFENQLNNG